MGGSSKGSRYQPQGGGLQGLQGQQAAGRWETPMAPPPSAKGVANPQGIAKNYVNYAPSSGGGGGGIGRNELAGILAERDRGNMFNARNGTGGDRGFGRSPMADWQRMMYSAADWGMDPRTGQVMYPGVNRQQVGTVGGLPAPAPNLHGIAKNFV